MRERGFLAHGRYDALPAKSASQGSNHLERSSATFGFPHFFRGEAVLSSEGGIAESGYCAFRCRAIPTVWHRV